MQCIGYFKNFNTIEDFKAVDKTALFNEVAGEVSTLCRDYSDSKARLRRSGQV